MSSDVSNIGMDSLERSCCVVEKYTITSAVVGEEKCVEEFWNCLEMAEYAMMRDVLVGTQSFHLFIYFAAFLGRL